MTDTPEHAAENDPAPSAKADAATTPRRRSVWTRLNRTNRIAALVLGAVAAVFVAALIFGAGLLVGAEYGDEEGHHEGAGTSEYGDGDHGSSGEHGGDRGESGNDANNEGADNESSGGSESDGDQGQRDEQARPDVPDGQAPGQSNVPPRP